MLGSVRIRSIYSPTVYTGERTSCSDRSGLKITEVIDAALKGEEAARTVLLQTARYLGMVLQILFAQLILRLSLSATDHSGMGTYLSFS